MLATLQSPVVKLKHAESRIPSGMTINLKVSLHDNLGQEFSHSLQDTTALVCKVSHNEQIAVNFDGNFSVAVNVPRETATMLSIGLKDVDSVRYDEDFVKLSVSKTSNKFPTKTIFSVGDIICFDSPLASINNWQSSDETIVRVDRNTGIGHVLSSRSKFGEPVTVMNGNERSGYIKYDLEIRDADSVEFFKTNDIFNGKNYKAHLVIKNHLQIDKLFNLITQNATACSSLLSSAVYENFFSCNLKLLNAPRPDLDALLNLLRALPVFDRNAGAYACEIESRASITDIMAIIKSDDVSLELVVALPNGITSSSQLKLVPAINVSPQEIALEKLDQQHVTITGLDKVLQRIEVTASDVKAIEITPLTKTHGLLEYKLRARRQLSLDETIFVNVHSPLTQQTVQIPIQSSTAAPKCVTQPFQSVPSILLSLISNFGLIISALIVLSATIWGKFILTNSKGVEHAKIDVV